MKIQPKNFLGRLFGAILIASAIGCGQGLQSGIMGDEVNLRQAKVNLDPTTDSTQNGSDVNPADSNGTLSEDEINARITALNKRLNEMMQQLEEQQNNQKSFSSLLESLTTKYGSLDETVKALALKVDENHERVMIYVNQKNVELLGYIGDLQESAADFASQLIQVGERLTTQETSLQRLQSENGQLLAAQESLRTDVNANSAAIQVANSLIDQYRSELQQQIDASNLKYDGIVSGLRTELDTKINALQANLTSADEARRLQIEQEISRLQADYSAQIQQVIADQQVVNQALSWRIDLNQQELLAKIIEVRTDAENALDLQVRTLQDQQTDLGLALQGIKKLSTATASTVAELLRRVDTNETQLQEYIASADARLAAQDDRLTAIDTSIDDLTGQYTDLSSTVSNLDQRLSGLLSTQDEAIRNLRQQTETQFTAVFSLIDGLTDTTSDLSTRMTAAEDQLDQLEIQFLAHKAVLTRVDTDLTKTMGDLTDARQALQSQITELQADTEANAKTITLLQGRVGAIDTALQQVSGQITDNSTELQGLAALAGELQTAVQRADSTANTALGVANQAALDIIATNSQVSGIKADLSSALGRIGTLEADVQKIQQDISKLTTDVDRRLATLAGKVDDITAMFGEKFDAVNATLKDLGEDVAKLTDSLVANTESVLAAVSVSSSDPAVKRAYDNLVLAQAPKVDAIIKAISSLIQSSDSLKYSLSKLFNPDNSIGNTLNTAVSNTLLNACSSDGISQIGNGFVLRGNLNLYDVLAAKLVLALAKDSRPSTCTTQLFCGLATHVGQSQLFDGIVLKTLDAPTFSSDCNTAINNIAQHLLSSTSTVSYATQFASLYNASTGAKDSARNMVSQLKSLLDLSTQLEAEVEKYITAVKNTGPDATTLASYNTVWGQWKFKAAAGLSEAVAIQKELSLQKSALDGAVSELKYIASQSGATDENLATLSTKLDAFVKSTTEFQSMATEQIKLLTGETEQLARLVRDLAMMSGYTRGISWADSIIQNLQDSMVKFSKSSTPFLSSLQTVILQGKNYAGLKNQFCKRMTRYAPTGNVQSDRMGEYLCPEYYMGTHGNYHAYGSYFAVDPVNQGFFGYYFGWWYWFYYWWYGQDSVLYNLHPVNNASTIKTLYDVKAGSEYSTLPNSPVSSAYKLGARFAIVRGAKFDKIEIKVERMVPRNYYCYYPWFYYYYYNMVDCTKESDVATTTVTSKLRYHLNTQNPAATSDGFINIGNAKQFCNFSTDSDIGECRFYYPINSGRVYSWWYQTNRVSVEAFDKNGNKIGSQLVDRSYAY